MTGERAVPFRTPIGSRFLRRSDPGPYTGRVPVRTPTGSRTVERRPGGAPGVGPVARSSRRLDGGPVVPDSGVVAPVVPDGGVVPPVVPDGGDGDPVGCRPVGEFRARFRTGERRRGRRPRERVA
ncbi:hypothetical protein TNCT6_45440 [Streptomyces sp. 6-11-2]|nr:hypothetical protein TNCT6_45440 [Streptomyces sp. 6-11-2]